MGGKPLLMGVDFYREVATISRKLRGRDYFVSNSIQSNGTLVTEALLDFIEEENDFRLGLSLDGPNEVNDKTRKYADGRGVFEDVMRGIKLVKKRRTDRDGKINVGGGVIVVLNRGNIGQIREIYEFFKRERINIKVNPIVPCTVSVLNGFGLTPIEYGKGMCELFDLWINDYDSIDIDPFADIMGNLMTGIPFGCNYSVSCRNSFVSIGPQGDIYPCGRFDGIPEFKMGNVNGVGGLANALNSEIQCRLKDRGLETIQGCSSCDFGKICNGGCMHNAFEMVGDVMKKDGYCVAYKKIFKHVEEFLHSELAEAEAK